MKSPRIQIPLADWRFSFSIPRGSHQSLPLSPADQGYSFVWSPVKIVRVFPIPQPSKDSHCEISNHSHQSSQIPQAGFSNNSLTLLSQQILSLLQLQRLKGSLYPQESGQGFIFPDSSHRFYYLQLSRIYFPQQYSESAYMRIHYIHIS